MGKTSLLFVRDPSFAYVPTSLTLRNDPNPLLICLGGGGDIWQVTVSKSAHSIPPPMCSFTMSPCHSSVNVMGGVGEL